VPLPSGTKAYCPLPFEELFITYTGEVLFCCSHDPSKTLGNVLRSSLEEIWNSALAREVRVQTTSPALHPVCRQGCWASDRIARGEPALSEPRESPWPSKITISLPDSHCNIGGEHPTPETACLMCGRAAVGFTVFPDQTDTIVARVKPLVEHLSVLAIGGVAEAFWKARIFEILEQLGFARYADRITVETNSNGTTLSERTRARWFHTCPSSYLVVSIDAATAETYRKIRRLDAYDTVLQNLRGYARERARGRQRVFLSYNINLLNIREVEGMVETAAELGVDGVTFTLTHVAVDQIRPYVIGDDTALLFAKAHKKAVKRAEELGVNLTFARFLHGDYPHLVELKAC
jgi:MoaA/NifB/PqqE/SkfB family radical SAM enzyme